MRIFGALAVLIATTVAAQKPATPDIPKVEIISVKQHTQLGDSGSIGVRADGIYAVDVPLQFVLNMIYKREIPAARMVGLPGWVTTDHWDIVGKIAPEDAPKLQHLTSGQLAAMRTALLEQVLHERFNYAAHTEQVEGRIYALVPDKSGIKVRASDTAPKPFKTPWSEDMSDRESVAVPGKIAGHDVPINQLVNALNSVGDLGDLVVDRSGLSGNFDFALQWSIDSEADMDNGRTGEDLPSLLTAIQEQLGFRLEPARGLITRLVVDHIERPSAN